VFFKEGRRERGRPGESRRRRKRGRDSGSLLCKGL